MSGSSKGSSLIERLLDVSVFAPIGLLVDDQAVPELAKTGRKQIRFAQSLGRVAISGLIKGSPRPTSSPTNQKTTSKVDGSNGTAKSTMPPSSEVAGYDDMTARQVIELVATFTLAEARWVRTREQETKKRVTVFRALDARDF